MPSKTPALLLLLIIVASCTTAWTYGGDVLSIAADHARDWRQGGMSVLIAFWVIQMLVAGFGILPASLTGVAIGCILGPINGFLVAALGTLAGAALSFALARSALRPFVLAALARWQFTPPADKGGDWRFVCMLRLSPILPFAPASFALGAIGIRWRDFMIGTLASLPSLAAYVWLGAATPVLNGGGESLSHPVLNGLFWLGLAMTALLAVQWGGCRVAARSQ